MAATAIIKTRIIVSADLVGLFDLKFPTKFAQTLPSVDAHAVSPGLMVRSHHLLPALIPRPRAWRLEPWAAPSFEMGAQAMLEFAENAYVGALLRMRRISRPPLRPRFILNEIRFNIALC